MVEDYKRRFKVEYQELGIRIKRLESYLDGTLDCSELSSYDLLMEQYRVMLKYQNILKERAKRERIDLK